MPTKKTAKPDAPTAVSFNALQRAFDFFNKQLFAGRLPPAMILLHRKQGANGYFWPERFSHRDLDNKLHEIAINPSTMRGRTDRDVLSTLAHEMVHHEQQCFGKPGKGSYHNAEWGEWMKRIGLQPKSLDKPGTEVGHKVTHEIVEGGAFDKACTALLATGLSLPYSARVVSLAEKKRAKVKRASKTKFTCPSCDANAWGKPDLNLVCGKCDEHMEIAE